MNVKEKEKEIKRLERMLERNKDNDNEDIVPLKVHWIKLKEKLEAYK